MKDIKLWVCVALYLLLFTTILLGGMVKQLQNKVDNLTDRVISMEGRVSYITNEEH